MDGSKEHRAQAAARLTPLGKRYFELIEFDESEDLILEIRKHPFGLLLVELTGLFVTVVVALVTIVLPSAVDFNTLLGVDDGLFKSIIIGVGLILTILSLIGTVIASILYRSNVIFVTTDKIAQVLYTSIFNRKISQLSIGDVQDVTVTQKGIFARIFNYGTLVIETAGEQQNYTFTYVPKPYESSKAIIGAHENNLHKFGN